MKNLCYICVVVLISGVVVGCSSIQQTQTGDTDSQNSQAELSQNTPTTKSDPMQGLSDAEKQYMQLYIDEGKKRLQNIGQGWQSIDNGNERADRIRGYNVYTRVLSSYPNDQTRKKVFVAVYEEGGVPVQSLEDLSSTNKKGNIIVDGISYTPYMDAGFFFESEFTDNGNSELTIEFKNNGEVITNTVDLP